MFVWVGIWRPTPKCPATEAACRPKLLQCKPHRGWQAPQSAVTVRGSNAVALSRILQTRCLCVWESEFLPMLGDARVQVLVCACAALCKRVHADLFAHLRCKYASIWACRRVRQQARHWQAYQPSLDDTRFCHTVACVSKIVSASVSGSAFCMQVCVCACGYSGVRACVRACVRRSIRVCISAVRALVRACVRA